MLASSLLSGCDATNEVDVLNAGSPPSSQHTLTGRVVSENGQPLSGVRVIVNERTTDAKVETTSGPDGSYAFELPDGVYDVGLDRPGDSQTATCFYGPVSAAGGRQSDLVLRQANVPRRDLFINWSEIHPL